MSNKIMLMDNQIPAALQTIPNPPKHLYITGVDLKEVMRRPRVAIVGSRKVSAYGENITTMFATALARQGVVIVSGLALGVDALAHTAALKAGGLTIAVLPSGLDAIYPGSHRRLAERITEQGLLLTEYPDKTKSFKANFVARNRLVSGISDAVLITEAAENSGTLHTAKFALAQGRAVFAIPGNITSPMSAGTNQLIRSGATLVTSANDILTKLNITGSLSLSPRVKGSNPHEQKILDLLQAGISNGSELLSESQLDLQLFNQSLTMLEIAGAIHPLGNNQWRIT